MRVAELPDGLRLDLRAGMQLSAAEYLGLRDERELLIRIARMRNV